MVCLKHHMPMFVVLRQWAGAIIVDRRSPIEDVWEETGPAGSKSPKNIHRFSMEYNAPFALLPYIDLPYEILDKEGWL